MTLKEPNYTDEQGRNVHEIWTGDKLSSVQITDDYGYSELTTFDERGKKTYRRIRMGSNVLEESYENGFLSSQRKELWAPHHIEQVKRYYPQTTFDGKKLDKEILQSVEIFHDQKDYIMREYSLTGKLTHEVVQDKGTLDEKKYHENGNFSYEKIINENGDSSELWYDEDNHLTHQESHKGNLIFSEWYNLSGKVSTTETTLDGEYTCIQYWPNTKIVHKDIKLDANGVGYKRHYRGDGKTLYSEKKILGKNHNIEIHYEEDGITPKHIREDAFGKVKESFYEKGKLIRSELASRERGDLEIKYLDAKDRLTSSEIMKTLKDGYRTDYFDAKGKLTGYVIEKELRDDNKNHIVSRYAPDGKLIKQERTDYEQGKYVVIEPGRSLVHKLFDLTKGGTWGDVSVMSFSEERSKVNKKLKMLLKSGAEAKKVVANYRATQGKAPNPKVHKKLMEIHQAGK